VRQDVAAAATNLHAARRSRRTFSFSRSHTRRTAALFNHSTLLSLKSERSKGDKSRGNDFNFKLNELNVNVIYKISNYVKIYSNEM
jgi:hypothetical protein